MTFDELKRALDLEGVEWVPAASPYGSTVLMGKFQRMYQGKLHQAILHLNHKDEPIEREMVEHVYAHLGIVPDTDTKSWH